MSVRPVGIGLPNPLRINGQEIETRITPVEGQRQPIGTQTKHPVEAPTDPFAPQEEAFDLANATTLRGENASAKLLGNKRSKKRELGRKKTSDAAAADHKRIEGVFAEGDPNNKQQKAYDTAAEFEEKVKEADLSFARKAAQVEAGSTVYSATYDDEKGSIIAGETELYFEDTVPDAALPVATDTQLRSALGLEAKKREG